MINNNIKINQERKSERLIDRMIDGQTLLLVHDCNSSHIIYNDWVHIGGNFCLPFYV